MTLPNHISLAPIEDLIYTVRELQVMLDSDLARLYQTETRYINRAFKRNPERFPGNFAFQLTPAEWDCLRCRSGTLKAGRGQHRKYNPYVFTEQGVAMLSAVLNSATAIKVSVQVMQAFVYLRAAMAANRAVFIRLDNLEHHQQLNESRFEQVFRALERPKQKLPPRVFFHGQVFDAYATVSKLVRMARQSIILIDNYIDETTLTLLSKKNNGVRVALLSRTNNNRLALDLQKVNEQYGGFELYAFSCSHDRFLIMDEVIIYHLGASLKDLGKKWFAFSKMDRQSVLCIMDAVKSVTGW